MSAARGPVDAWIGIGSNLGDSVENVTSALFALDDLVGAAVVTASSVYRTAPVTGDVGPAGQADYHNAVACLRTTLDPHALLGELQRIEAAFGRDRADEERWGPRVLDLDLLLYGDEVVDDPPRLVVPHPRLRERAFVLVPLVEAWPGGTLPPDGTRLTRALAGVAPIEGIELEQRLETEVPGAGGHVERPAAPDGGGAVLADDWSRPAPAEDPASRRAR